MSVYVLERMGSRSPRNRQRAIHPVGRTLGRALTAAAIGLVAFGFWSLTPVFDAEAKEGGTFEYGCRVQRPQKFLERRAFLKGGMLDSSKHARALRYFAEHYGNAGDDATTRWNSEPAIGQAKSVKFFGLPISIHSKIAGALACVEKRIRKTCHGRSSYTPISVGGFRDANTYRGTEVSNHLFGIAIDIDPERNPCCGCVDPWPNSPLCKGDAKTVYERTALTKGWIRAFQRYGFDWLGHDELADTMHFEFLGDPDRIAK